MDEYKLIENASCEYFSEDYPNDDFKKETESLYSTLVQSIQIALSKNFDDECLELCKELMLLIRSNTLNYILDTEQNSILSLVIQLISPEKILVLGEIGFKICELLCLYSKDKIYVIISDLPIICEYLSSNSNEELFISFLELIAQIDFIDHAEDGIQILQILLDTKLNIAKLPIEWNENVFRHILVYINSLLNQNIDLGSIIATVDDVIIYLLNHNDLLEEILYIITNCSFTYYLESFKNETFITFIKENLLLYTKEIVNFLHNILMKDPKLIVDYNISYIDFYNIVTQKFNQVSVEYILAFMNCYFNNMLTIITYEMFSNLVRIYIENADEMTWNTKLLFSIHICDIISRDKSFIKEINQDTRDHTIIILSNIIDHNEEFNHKICSIFIYLLSNNLDVSDNEFIKYFIEDNNC